MNKKYYQVVTMCGHVGRGKYVKKVFPIEAENGREAAETARWYPRVKHHFKNAIIECKEIDSCEYDFIKEMNNNDPYFKCKNVQEQNMYCPDIYDDVQHMYDFKDDDDYQDRRKERIAYRKKKAADNKYRNNKIQKFNINYYCGESY